MNATSSKTVWQLQWTKQPRDDDIVIKQFEDRERAIEYWHSEGYERANKESLAIGARESFRLCEVTTTVISGPDF